MPPGDQRDDLFIVHCHIAEGGANRGSGGERITAGVRAFRVNVDQTHFSGANSLLIQTFRMTMCQPFGFITPVNVQIRFPHVFTSRTKAKGSKAGDIRYVDITGDGKVTPDDKTFLGSRIPKYTFGLNFGGEYKGFDFSVLLQGVAKVKGMLSVYAGHAFYQEGNIQKWQMENCWNVQQDNRYPEYPRLEIMSNAGSNNTLTSDFWVLDASFLKVRNVQLGYTLPEHIVKKFGSTGMRFYVSLDNPLTFKGYRKGWDPENTSNNGQYYPTMSTYTLGLTLKF